MKTQIFLAGDHVSVVTDCTEEADFLETFTDALRSIPDFSSAMVVSGFNVLARLRGYKSQDIQDRSTLVAGAWPAPGSEPIGEGHTL